EKRDAFKSWTVLLAIAAFGLSLLGTFLVRSGVLTSVHAFATDPTRGVFILAFLGIVVGGALALYAWRGPGTLRGADYALTSREAFLLANSVLLSVATATVLLGTLYPLALDALGLGKISVGPPYFNAVFVPLMAPLLVLLGLGQEAHWKRDRLARLVRPLRYPLVGTLVFVTAAVLMLDPGHRIEAALGLALATWVIAATAGAIVARCRARQRPLVAMFALPPAFLGQCLAHVGFAVTVVGVTLVSLYGIDKHARMAVGDVAELGGVSFEMIGIRTVEGPNYTASAARFAVRRGDTRLTELEAEKRLYTVRGMPMTEAGIAPGLTRDLYVALGEPLEDGAWSVRLSVKPYVRWLWLGALLMAAGALLATRDPRFRRARVTRTEALAASSDGARDARG
ncbi:MAG: cytochrome c-type biogenesis CcmF C-terminal domain-containing protein, partial [Gammaproteobacteria bacterium]